MVVLESRHLTLEKKVGDYERENATRLSGPAFFVI